MAKFSMDSWVEETPEMSVFLNTIKQDVEDEVSRLVFADWLEDQGDPRSEWLRGNVSEEEAEELKSLFGITFFMEGILGVNYKPFSAPQAEAAAKRLHQTPLLSWISVVSMCVLARPDIVEYLKDTTPVLLDLKGTSVFGEYLRYFFGTKMVGAVRRLDLSENCLLLRSDIRDLVREGGFASLEWVDLRGCYFPRDIHTIFRDHHPNKPQVLHGWFDYHDEDDDFDSEYYASI